jgi:hypothetical protein
VKIVVVFIIEGEKAGQCCAATSSALLLFSLSSHRASVQCNTGGFDSLEPLSCRGFCHRTLSSPSGDLVENTLSTQREMLRQFRRRAVAEQPFHVKRPPKPTASLSHVRHLSGCTTTTKPDARPAARGE